MIGGANVLENASWMDPVGGLVISLMVVQAGLGNTRSAILELADAGVDDEMKRKVTSAAADAVQTMSAASGVRVRQVQGVKAGQTYLMDVELGVPEAWTVGQTREAEDLIRERVGAKVRGVKRLKVRFVPDDDEVPDFGDEFVRPGNSPESSPEPEEKHPHSH